MKVLSLLLLCLIMFSSGCQSANKEPQGDHVDESTADYINIGDRHYLNAWEMALTDPTKLVKIGEVESGSRMPKGAAIYEIEGYPERDIVAVEDAGDGPGLVANTTGYSIYVWYEGSDKPSHYPDIDESTTKQIKIYRDASLVRTLDGDEAESFISLLNQQGPHNEFQAEHFREFTVLLISDHVLGKNYGISEDNGEFGLAHIESKLPAEIARYFEE